MSREYEGRGIRFEYPAGWDIDESEDGPRATITVQSPTGPAFVMVTVDEGSPAPAEVADEALDAMREEYPNLEAAPAVEEFGQYRAVGYDVEFFSLDMLIECVIRGYRTPRRTILVFAQWSDVDEGDEDPEEVVRAVRRTLAETEAG